MAAHLIFTDELPAGAPADLTIRGDEAHHALRVKRVQQGDPVLLLDGRGRIAECVVAGSGKQAGVWELHLQARRVTEAPPIAPRIEVYCPAPKGPRIAELIDALSQVGAASWSPLRTARSIGDERARPERLARIAAEASKQCGRPWRLEIGTHIDFGAALGGGGVVLADASGEPPARTGVPTIRLLVGPEGGWAPEELQAARSAGARIARFGPHTMRIETAAPVAAAILLAIEQGAHAASV
jgi:16S rRNA (uracil1498-N3)-methyltransferase